MIKELAIRKIPATQQELYKFLENIYKKAYNLNWYNKWGKLEYNLDFEESQKLNIDSAFSRFRYKGNRYNIYLDRIVTDWLIRKYITKSSQYQVVSRYSEIDPETVILSLNKIFNTFGLSIESYRKDLQGLILILEPIVGTPVEVPRFLYTFTLLENKDSILRKGLIPKRAEGRPSFRYPPRIFLFRKYSPSLIEKMRFAVHTFDESIEDIYYGGVDIQPIIVFQVDTKKLDKRIKFYEDAASVINGKITAVWTPTHIPSSAIKIKYEDKVTEDTFV